MKTKSIINKITQIAAITLFCANAATVQAAEPEIVINSIPPLGQTGYAEGKVVWDELTPANVGQYAIIAVLNATWGECYAKPNYDNYLNALDASGNFFIQIAIEEGDKTINEVIFYLVKRSNFNGVNGNTVNQPSKMTSKYVSTKTIYRNSWIPPTPSLTSDVRPGFVAAGTKIKLSYQGEGAIRYTLDGSNPITSSSAQTYNGNVFAVPDDGALLVKAVVENSGSYGSVHSFVWLPKEPLVTPFWGLNVSLALNGENFGYQLTENATRERMTPIVALTKWVRTFGTVGNGQEYINNIAKESGLRTMIGLYITNDAANNNAQIEGLRKILEKGATPDLIAVGNETFLLGVDPTTLTSCIDAVRKMVLERGVIIPVGSVDIVGASWSPAILEKLDFVGVNIYNGTWDNTPENQMLAAMKQVFENKVSEFSSKKLVLLTETGTPYYEGTYSLPDGTGTQTASKEKAAKYLCGFLDWIKQGDIPAFYFEAYDEPVKSQGGGHIIEQYFGIMDGKMDIHSLYCECITVHNCRKTTIPPINSNGNITILYPNPTTHTVFLETESNIKVYNMDGTILQELFGNQVDLSAYPQGVYFLQINGVWNKVVKK